MYYGRTGHLSVTTVEFQYSSTISHNHSAASSKNSSNSSSSWKSLVPSLIKSGETDIGSISSGKGVSFEDKDMHGSGTNALLVGSTETEEESCVAPAIFTAGM